MFTARSTKCPCANARRHFVVGPHSWKQQPPMWDLKRLRTDLVALLLLVVIVFSGLSLFSYDPADPPAHAVYPARLEVLNWCGPIGAYLAHYVRHWLGLGIYVLLAGALVFDLRLFSRTTVTDPVLRIFGGLLATSAVCAALQGLLPG